MAKDCERQNTEGGVIVSCTMEEEIREIKTAICGPLDGRGRGMAEGLRSLEEALQRHIAGADKREARLERVEKEIYGNGVPGLRADVRQIRRGVKVLKWVGMIVVSAWLLNWANLMWGNLLDGGRFFAPTSGRTEGTRDARPERGR